MKYWGITKPAWPWTMALWLKWKISNLEHDRVKRILDKLAKELPAWLHKEKFPWKVLITVGWCVDPSSDTQEVSCYVICDDSEDNVWEKIFVKIGEFFDEDYESFSIHTFDFTEVETVMAAYDVVEKYIPSRCLTHPSEYDID